MKYILYIPIVLTLFFISCEEHNLESQEGEMTPLFTASIATIATRANGAGYGKTPYDTTTFAHDDAIGIFMTQHKDDVNAPMFIEDVYKNYFNVGYCNDTLRRTWSKISNQPTINVPIFPKPYDFFAYYPWAPSGKQQIVLNCDSSKSIQFRILQDQALSNIPLCNVMRAVPIRNKVFDFNNSATWTVNFQFEHILSLIEFQISREHGNGWVAGDSLVLDRVVVLGTSISTEGVFDITGPSPNVRIVKNNFTSKNSIFKADANGTGIPDAVTGATPRGKHYLCRTVIVPPVNTTSNDFIPEPGEQAEVEFLIALRWKSATGTDWRYTNRRYIAHGVTFESGKKYLFRMQVSKIDPPQHVISIKAEQSGNWDQEFTWATTFN